MRPNEPQNDAAQDGKEEFNAEHDPADLKEHA